MILHSNGVDVSVRASMLSRLFHKQAFSRDIDDDMERVRQSKDPLSVYFILYELLWTMAKTEAYYRKESIPPFSQWKKTIDPFDLTEVLQDMFFLMEKAFFIQSRKRKAPESENISDEDITALLLSVALKMGLSFDELNELSTQMFYEIVMQYSGKNEEDEVKRLATPSEAEAFFG